MKLIFLVMAFFLGGCATKYVLPGNRFITPESQGDAFRGQVEVQKTKGNELSVNYEGKKQKGVLYDEVSRTGFLLSNSLFDKFDIIWSHTASANSMIGGKFQLVGDSRVARSEGHKISIAALIGSNEHETDDESIDFTLGGHEYLLLYGYRLMPEALLYTSVSQATYDFEGTVKKGPLYGQRPRLKNQVMSLSLGLEASVDPVFAKVEFTYQSIASDKTKDYSHSITGLSIGYAW